MKFSLQRLLTVAATVTVVAFVVAFIVRHDKHGFALYLGDVAWNTFLIGLLVTIALALGATAKLIRNRRAARVVIR